MELKQMSHFTIINYVKGDEIIEAGKNHFYLEITFLEFWK